MAEFKQILNKVLIMGRNTNDKKEFVYANAQLTYSTYSESCSGSIFLSEKSKNPISL